MNAAETFDALAPDYDRLWSSASSGSLQRDAFWRKAEPWFRDAHAVLDVGCGTGDDAVRLMSPERSVCAVDISAGMVAVARARGIDARVMAADALDLEGPFDAVLSNFGALNCVSSLRDVSDQLARLTRPGAFVVISLLSRFCLWETLWFLASGSPRKAARRWGGMAAGPGGITVRYPSGAEVCRAFENSFRFVTRFGVGVAIPPSYVPPMSERACATAARVDSALCSLPLFRSLGDHSVFVFRRN